MVVRVRLGLGGGESLFPPGRGGGEKTAYPATRQKRAKSKQRQSRTCSRQLKLLSGKRCGRVARIFEVRGLGFYKASSLASPVRRRETNCLASGHPGHPGLRREPWWD